MTTAQSRPYRALLLIIGVWFVGRAAALWQELGPPPPQQTPMRVRLQVAASSHRITIAGATTPPIPASANDDTALDGPMTGSPRPRPRSVAPRLSRPEQAAYSHTPDSSPAEGISGNDALTLSNQIVVTHDDLPPNVAPRQRAEPARRLSVSAWMLARAAGQRGLSDAGQLGGSQAGVRGYYALGGSPVSLTARFSAPLADPRGKEAAFGVAIRPIKRVPFSVIVEQRVAVDHGGRNDLEMIATGGLYDRPLGHRLTLSGYVQAGVVGVKARDAFIDGAVEVEHPLARIAGARLTLGGATWGGAQPGVSRLDAGPIAALHFRIGTVNAKAEASYRVRVIGTARPATGPALSIGTDF